MKAEKNCVKTRKTREFILDIYQLHSTTKYILNVCLTCA